MTALGIVTAAVVIAVAAPSPAQKCAAFKLKAAGKGAHSQLRCYSQAAMRDALVEAGCLDKASVKLHGAFDKADSKGGCENVADGSAVEAVLDLGTDAVVTALPYDSNTSSRKCGASKLKASGKRSKSVLGCEAKGAKKGETVDFGCLARADDKFTRAFSKAESKGGCATLDDAAAIAATVDATTTAAAGLLNAECGDGIVGPGEICDGADAAACPGQCLASCMCPGLCGNGVVEVGEECDDGGTSGGDGCAADCQLEDASALCAGVATTSGTSLTKQLVGNFSSPVHVAAAPLDPRRLFVVEQAGRIRVVRDGVPLPTPFLDIASQVASGGERGLLSVAFHPDYEGNGRFFVNYTDLSGDTVVVRFNVSGDPDVADAASQAVLFTIAQPFSNHNGGQIAFGPDGYLYVGMGDGGGGGDPVEAGQDDTTLLAKMLRVDVDVAGAPYHAVPASNPNAGAGLPLGLIWAKGLRNPWRFSFDRANGDLYIADVGQNAWEEISYQPGTSSGGENYGWDIFEGNACFEPAPDPDCPDPPTGFTPPIHEFDHATGCSITGGHVYRGCAMPDLAGTYFYTDFCNPFIRTFEVSGGVAGSHVDRTTELGVGLSGISSFGEDARGELYIVELGGEVWQIVPN